MTTEASSIEFQDMLFSDPEPPRNFRDEATALLTQAGDFSARALKPGIRISTRAELRRQAGDLRAQADALIAEYLNLDPDDPDVQPRIIGERVRLREEAAEAASRLAVRTNVLGRRATNETVKDRVELDGMRLAAGERPQDYE